jgi:hypothetical protein
MRLGVGVTLGRANPVPILAGILPQARFFPASARLRALGSSCAERKGLIHLGSSSIVSSAVWPGNVHHRKPPRYFRQILATRQNRRT